MYSLLGGFPHVDRPRKSLKTDDVSAESVGTVGERKYPTPRSLTASGLASIDRSKHRGEPRGLDVQIITALL